MVALTTKFAILICISRILQVSAFQLSESYNAGSVQHLNRRRPTTRLCLSEGEDANILSRRQWFKQCTRQVVGTAAVIGLTTATPDKSIASTSSTVVSDATKPFSETVSGAISGAALATAKTAVKFPLDTVAVRLQMPNSKYDTIEDLARLFNGCYNGVALSLLFNIPGGAVFFAVKDFTKAILKQSTVFESSPKWVTTSLAVAAAQIPYWLIRNPSEVVKVRQQAGIEGYGHGVSALDAVQRTLATTKSSTTSKTGFGGLPDGLNGFYIGYWENIAYAYPADVIKFVAYESITQGRKDLSPTEGAVAGAIATAVAQFTTTPLDVVRNRLMTRSKPNKGAEYGIDEESADIEEGNLGSGNPIAYFQTLATLAKEEGLEGLFAGASPRVGKAILSGAVQFATYEETKQKITNFILRG